jgi:hypothetical protein
MKTILKYISAIIVTAIFCWMSYDTYAQKETELFIPIGQSPGVSGKLSVMGKCGSVIPNDSVVSLMQQQGSMTNCKINHCTAIYLDRSKLKLTNIKGTLSDIKPGSLMEVKYMDNKPGSLAEWIKVQME